jgi:hypothetical protein
MVSLATTPQNLHSKSEYATMATRAVAAPRVGLVAIGMGVLGTATTARRTGGVSDRLQPCHTKAAASPTMTTVDEISKMVRHPGTGLGAETSSAIKSPQRWYPCETRVTGSVDVHDRSLVRLP